MTQHVDFREGRRLGAADLNRESASRESDTVRHLEAAHGVGPGDRQLIGTTVTHPTGTPAIEVTPDGPAAGVRIDLRGTTPALELGVSGGHHAFSDVTTHGVGVAATGALRLVSQPATADPSEPWSVRAVDIHSDDGILVGRELRVELSPAPGSPPSESRVAVGTVDINTGFNPVLVVDAAGNVTIEGDLEVAGSVSQGEIPADPEDPRFVELLTEAVARRVVGAAIATSNPVLNLKVTTNAAAADQTSLDISIEPSSALSRWGAALETQRGGANHFRMIGVGGPAAASQKLTIDTAPVPWDPPLSTSTPGRLIAAVVAFDAHGGLHAQRVTTDELTGE